MKITCISRHCSTMFLLLIDMDFSFFWFKFFFQWPFIHISVSTQLTKLFNSNADDCREWSIKELLLLLLSTKSLVALSIRGIIFIVSLFKYIFSFFQVTGSAFRPLTNIPHCCTKTHWGFFRPNVVDRPLSHDYGFS